uniref:NAD(P)-binding domain-containing protein n=1 Tax=Periophthalmus magnuspinnatus TaxID=409849 RepID=A0A3B3ZUK5_9GOBI
MKIAVLGATGQTGLYLVQQALDQGHCVTAVVRNPAKLTVQHENLKVVEANIFSADSLKSHFEGQDAVMSCLGFPTSFFSAVTGYTRSMHATVKAMREAKVNRLITMSSWYTEPNSGSQSPYMIRFLLLPMIRSILTNMFQMEQFLQKTSDIDWTVVRPPGLRNQSFLIKWRRDWGYFVPGSGGAPVSSAVARGDVARFMLSQLNNNAWIKKGVAITTN